ncbi:MAG: MBL fold metallo-hydrolase [Burkholderiaceae bacterium]|nr:MBL fold metallo-hydrolase [Burkholderiaceae bacterium]
MKRITALPIKGESYLLEYVEKRILIDGGYTGLSIATMLKKQLGELSVNLAVVACTHSDNDHAGGLVDLLDQPGIKVSEFWLPGSWKETVKDLVENTDLFYEELVKEIKEEPISEDFFSARDEEIDREISRMVSDVRIPDQDVLGDEVRTLGLNPAKTNSRRTAASKAKQAIRKMRKAPGVTARALDLIETAERIRKIALSANDHGVPVRWFDYVAYSRDRIATGGEDFLLPINAKELREPPILPGFTYRRFIALSRANRESLVFLSPGNDDDAHIDIMFCGDSPMGDGPSYANSFLSGKTTNKPLVVTAPHHGADSNAMAYSHIAAFGNVTFWIRAGGKPTHPQSVYRGLPGNIRTCTHCHHKKLPLQAVCITDKCEKFTDPQAWLTVRSHDCIC